MIKVYKRNLRTKTLYETKDIKSNCWINVIAPTDEDVKLLSKKLKVKEDVFKKSLDEQERSRIDEHELYDVFIINIPYLKNYKKYNVSYTIPLVIFYFKNNCVLTLCLKDSPLFKNIIDDVYKEKLSDFLEQFVFKIMLKSTYLYINDLKFLNKEIDRVEALLSSSTSNNDLLKLMHLQKSIVYFSNSIHTNQAVIEKLYKKFEDSDNKRIIEEVIIENKQAIDMVKVFSDLLNSTIEIYGTVISNNLNRIMKFLAGCTIVISIPTMVASFMGMNIPLGVFSENPASFPFILSISLLLSAIVAIILNKKNML